MTLLDALQIADPEEQRKAMNALPPIRLAVAELSFPEYFALLQMRGQMPNPTPTQVAEERQTALGLTREQQLALVIDGLHLLAEKGVVYLPGTRNAQGEPEFFLHPHIQLVSEAKPLSGVKSLLG